jgi:hypothetical protein
MTYYKSKHSLVLNTVTNFNRSGEIAYWAKKYNVETDIF